MLILEDENGRKIVAKKAKDMETESYDFSNYQPRDGTIDGNPHLFHHSNPGSIYYFKYIEENISWYRIVYFDIQNLNFKRVRQED